MGQGFWMAGEFGPLVATYGYVATFVGTLLEGETFLLLSGLAAQRGLLDLPILFVVSGTGAFVSDNLFFMLGRVLGPALLVRFPRLAPSAAVANALVQRSPNTAVVGVRFLYGMRAVGPAVIGAGSMAWSRYALWDAFAALLWGTCWTSVGFALGGAVPQLLGVLTQVGRWVLAGAVLGGAVAILVLYRRRRNAAGAARPTNL